MKLLVPAIPNDGGKSGITVYIREVIAALRACGHDVTEVRESDFLARHALFSMLHHLFVLPFKIKWREYDACILPAANRRAFCRYPIPTLAVVHDLSQYHVEAKYDAFRMCYIKFVLPFFVRRAHRVVAISRSTAADLTRYWKIPSDKVSVVYDGFTAPVREKVEVERRAVFYMSRIEHPGKNHENLIRAYSMLPREVAAAHPLVLAGGDWNGSEEVHRLARESANSEYIQFTGFVPAADLPRLWSEAACYVFPSRFEGFGLSLLEAMAAGIPVACSNTSSLGELGEGVAELFDPESPDEIADAIRKLIGESEGEREARVARGKARAAEFSWDRCARELTDAFARPRVFGVPITTDTMAGALDRLMAAEADPSGPKFFAFVNAHALNLAYGDPEFAEVLRGADAVWPDGSGVAIAGRKLGFPVPENVNGTDMFPLLCDRLAATGRRLFLYGARPGVAARAAENAVVAHSGLIIAGVRAGYDDDAEGAIAEINATNPDVVLVAMGMPIQEKWIAAHRHELKCRAVVAVGGLFDFMSGRIPRAPAWMRRLGIEWVFRFLMEPRRMFRRYIIGNPLFVFRLRRH